MSKKIAVAALGAVIAMGLGTAALAEMTPMQKNEKMMKSEMPKGFDKCYGIAKAGKNSCASAGHACAGQSKMDGDKASWVAVPKGTCDNIVGGSTTEG